MRGKPAEKLRRRTPQRVAEVLREHVVLEFEGIDRMYLNVYVPALQAVEDRGHPVASTAIVEPITRRFVESIELYTQANDIPMITFEKGQRKDDIANQRRAALLGMKGSSWLGKRRKSAPYIAPRNGVTRKAVQVTPGP